MDVPAHKSAFAAVVMTALFVALLVATLMADGNLVRYETPAPVYGVLLLLYATVALASTGLRPGPAALVFAGMLGVQAAMALLMSLLYSALSHGASDGFVYALSGYMPGLLMQSGVVFLSGPALAAQWSDVKAENRRAKLKEIAAAGASADMQSALYQFCTVEEIAGMLVETGDNIIGNGIWQRDPTAAYRRVAMLANSSGASAALFETGETAIWVEQGDNLTIALSLTSGESEYLAEKAAAIVRRLNKKLACASVDTVPASEHETKRGGEE